MGLDRLHREFVSAPRGPGKERARERLAKAIDDRLHRYFAARVDEQWAGDLVQEANETVWRKLPSFAAQHEQAFSRWVVSIARMLVMRVRQRGLPRSAQVVEFDSLDFVNPGTGPSTALRRRERARVLESELRHLATPQRRALVDQLEGGDVRSFAAREGLALTTVRTHRRRGRQRVQARVVRRVQTPETRSEVV